MDLQNVMLSILGLVIGAVASFFITRHYYKKSLVFEMDMRNLTYSLEKIYMNSKYPNIFDAVGCFEKSYMDQSPINKDVPHLSKVCCESNTAERGQNLIVLFRMVDLGRNLQSSGIEARNNLNNYNIPIISEGFGWYSCRMDIPSDAPLGSHNISFTFTDLAGYVNKQVFKYIVR